MSIHDFPAPDPKSLSLSSAPSLTPAVEREILLQRYINALDSNDAKTVELILIAAQDDDILTQQLNEIDLALVAELPLAPSSEIDQ